jgi:WD40 repeat protein
MARLFTRIAGTLITTLAVMLGAVSVKAQETSGLFDQPVLVIDPGMHTAAIRRADTDRAGRFAVTGSHDKTVRVWQLEPKPELAGTIRIPSGPGDVGKIYAVAMSPDGALIAAGGWTGSISQGVEHKVYLFSRDGELVKRIDGLPQTVHHLNFSRDGRYLAAGLGGRNGIRIFDRDKDWAESARDTDYGDSVYGLDFGADGRLATTSDDSYVRLYDAAFKLTARHKTAIGSEPSGVAFRPDGRRLAVGFDDSTAVELLDAQSLRPLKPPDVTGIGNGDLSKVSWSQDGNTLYAAGRFGVDGRKAVVAWSGGGAGERRLLFSGATDTVL